MVKKFFLQWTKALFEASVYILIGTFIIFTTLRISLVNTYQPKITTTVQNIKESRVGIIFGAGIVRDQPSLMLRDRLDAGYILYSNNKINKIIVSGDNRSVDHNEPFIMKKYLVAKGVAESDIQPDYAGRSTYETCIRAKQIFQVNSAILITQEYHLYRALFICDHLGIEVSGFSAGTNFYNFGFYDNIREFFSTTLAYINIYIMQKENIVLGEKIIV